MMSEHTKGPWEADPLVPTAIKSIYCSIDGDRSERHPVARISEGVNAIGNRDRIVADHNGCIGITDPETTVPELIRICQLASMRMATVDPNITLEEAVQEAFKLSREAESVLAKCGEVER